MGTSEISYCDQALRLDRVAGAYFQEVARLEENARIKTFVSVLAVGAVRSELRHRETDDG